MVIRDFLIWGHYRSNVTTHDQNIYGLDYHRRIVLPILNDLNIGDISKTQTDLLAKSFYHGFSGRTSKKVHFKIKVFLLSIPKALF